MLIFAATCGAGTEALVAGEIENFGASEIVEGRGVVTWRGEIESGYRACLWSRYSSRVYLKIAEFHVKNEESVYEGALSVDWQEHMESSTTFAVDCTVAAKALQIHSKYASLKVKDAIVDQFRDRCGERPSVDTGRPGIRVHLLIREDVAELSIDLSGESLHRRGYRVDTGIAPLKENLGAAIVKLSGWLDGGGGPLIDPMCGSATLLIEAALMYGDSAPGLSRNYFGFMGWRQHDRKLWNRLVDEAMGREDDGLQKEWPQIIGYDSDIQTVRTARKNLVQAGLEDKIHIEQQELALLQPPVDSEKGMLLSNLPFGERLSDAEEVSWLYRAIGNKAQDLFQGWRLGVFIANPELTDSFGLKWDDKHRLYNGSLQCRLLTTVVAGREPVDFRWQFNPEPAEGEGADFANRLKKNLKKVLKWAEKENITCFRVYDRDLPEFNISVDLYEKWVHVQEYAPPSSVDKKLSSARFQTALRAIRETLGLRADRVFIKTRERQRGKQQYQKKSARKKMHVVREGESLLLANFTDYLDTGIFLDHRPVRAKIHSIAKSKRFLNLFGYTGTATVQAASGGAASTVTVDLSNNYLHWARMNLALNGFDTRKNKIVAADCMQWLREDQGTYDLIFVDPPTFSNTKKDKRVFDVQRDHVELLTNCMERLSEDGLLIFSTNYRRFTLDQEMTELYQVDDIGDSTIPFDFSRNRKIHKCWEFRKRG
ncbi:bifunctional 23S rRNA (guanine(2069)-N(7))-methyltransferase RlmK/23S rRNA (guanine(2445)-N(2))-methyltransferase RlmL [Desulfosediminicola sp.]|uniref:bifunctional 23S rRNA (guanine(2069)-N(7))-methyltransferase RlmK/23S rRNA (guanine(2445)-N(2))-methyltransferase RlmL n=1 Tax=Desulfosediminicola sp. TaxID=2886825 RepID=UPI003AF1F4BB